MGILSFIFSLGILFAIYGFIWFFLELMLTLVRSGRPKTLFEEYIIKSVKYLFLTDVTFLFCFEKVSSELSLYHMVMALLVLLTFFIGKIQRLQHRKVILSPLNRSSTHHLFHSQAEIFVILGSILLFIAFSFYPHLAYNPVSLWFKSSIAEIEDTAFIGFIFRIIGFFFLIGMLLKMVNGVMYILSGKLLLKASSHFHFSKDKKEDEFDDYEEIP